MVDFPTSNDTLATATNLGYLSRFSPVGRQNATRTDSVNTPPPSSADKYDHFTFRHTTGLTKVKITLTLLESPHASFQQNVTLNLLQGFGIFVNGVLQGSNSSPPLPTGVALVDWGGTYSDRFFDNRSTFSATTKSFVFNVKANSTKSDFVITGLHEYQTGPSSFELVDLDYRFTISVIGEADQRNKVLGTASNDSLIGTNRDDLILGKAGNDLERGRNGNDEIRGDAGHDRVLGENGHDKLIGGTGNDNIVGGTGNDTLVGGVGNDFLRGGPGNDTLIGNSGFDRLFGDSGNDILRGGTHNDLLKGGSGNDSIYGDQGNDRMFGDSGADNLFGGTGNDVVRGGTGIDTIYGDAGNDRLFGDSGNDTINGGTGNDTIYGGSGEDVIIGGQGTNQIFGGGGNDQYFLTAPGVGIQVLNDLDTFDEGFGTDKIVLYYSDYPNIDANTGGPIDIILGRNFSFLPDPAAVPNNAFFTALNPDPNFIDLYYKDDVGTINLVAVTTGVDHEDFVIIV